VGNWLCAEVSDGLVPNRAGPDLPAKINGELAVADTAAGPAGRVLRFSGKGFLEVPHDPRLMLHAAYTLDAWICPKTFPAMGARIIDKLKAGVDNGYLLDTCPGNALRLITEQGHLGYNAKLAPDCWVHVTATFEATAGLCLYIDGKLVASCPPKPPPTRFAEFGAFYARLCAAQLADSYEACHARLIVDYVHAIHARQRLIDEGRLQLLPEPSQAAADKSYVDTVRRLADGLRTVLGAYSNAPDPHRQRVWTIWREVAPK
jgi:hypothetical protein